MAIPIKRDIGAIALVDYDNARDRALTTLIRYLIQIVL